jgi:hypothetical protein
MAINISGTTLTGGTSLTATDSSSRILFEQDSGGRVRSMRDASGNAQFPLFCVGLGTAGWTTGNQFVPANYTGGNGYKNVGNCYNTSTYKFTAPWDGVYLFSMSAYTLGGASTTMSTTDYTRMMFYVNGALNTRRPGYPYRMKVYGVSNYHGTDSSEIIPLVAGDYVQLYFQQSNGRYYPPYSAWQGVYLGASS